jgi:hypothetical protein
MLLPQGGFKYPELASYFRSYGETYRQSLLRLYRVVLECTRIQLKFWRSSEVMVIAHGQTYHIFRGLLAIGRLILSSKITFRTGDTCSLLWNVYKNCCDSEKVTGVCNMLDVSCFQDPVLMSLLKKEVDYLKRGIS